MTGDSWRLDSGRRIDLCELRQSDFYEGLLEGLLTRERNRRGLVHRVEKERQRASSLHVIDPVETPIEHDGDYPFGEPARLPRILCVGRFHSLSPALAADADYSELTVIWFQERFALPIAPDIEAQLVALDWAALAADQDY
jgi:hypothetical protein